MASPTVITPKTACLRCGAEFIPVKVGQKYCAIQCGAKARMERYKQRRRAEEQTEIISRHIDALRQELKAKGFQDLLGIIQPNLLLMLSPEDREEKKSTVSIGAVMAEEGITDVSN